MHKNQNQIYWADQNHQWIPLIRHFIVIHLRGAIPSMTKLSRPWRLLIIKMFPLKKRRMYGFKLFIKTALWHLSVKGWILKQQTCIMWPLLKYYRLTGEIIFRFLSSLKSARPKHMIRTNPNNSIRWLEKRLNPWLL